MVEFDGRGKSKSKTKSDCFEHIYVIYMVNKIYWIFSDIDI